MADPPLPIPDEPPSNLSPAAPSEDQNFFRNPALPFAFVRVCLYLILAEAISFCLSFLIRPYASDGAVLSPRNLMASETLALAGVFGAAAIMSRVERRPLGTYGLAARSAFGKDFWIGSVFGLAEISSVLGAAALFGCYHFGPLAMHGRELIRWAVFWGALFLFVALYEEFAFRGYVQYTFGRVVGFWPAAIVLSLLFGLVHRANPGESWVGILGVIVTGLFWSFTLWRTGALWFAVGMHASFDFGETFLYSVPDSGELLPGHLSNATLAGPTWLTGGSVGPEGSVLDFLALLLLFLLFRRLYASKNVPVSAQDSPANSQ